MGSGKSRKPCIEIRRRGTYFALCPASPGARWAALLTKWREADTSRRAPRCELWRSRRGGCWALLVIGHRAHFAAAITSWSAGSTDGSDMAWRVHTGRYGWRHGRRWGVRGGAAPGYAVPRAASGVYQPGVSAPAVGVRAGASAAGTRSAAAGPVRYGQSVGGQCVWRSSGTSRPCTRIPPLLRGKCCDKRSTKLFKVRDDGHAAPNAAGNNLAGATVSWPTTESRCRTGSRIDALASRAIDQCNAPRSRTPPLQAGGVRYWSSDALGRSHSSR